jgi:ribonuclease BN (tRNA processing enzyme)
MISLRCDLLVHEATNAYLPTWGDRGGAARLERETARHGHSTPQMAGRAAAAMRARTLLLNHFSQRYHPQQKALMACITRLAADAAGLDDGRVIAAYDALTLPVWQPDRGKLIAPVERRTLSAEEYDPGAGPTFSNRICFLLST